MSLRKVWRSRPWKPPDKDTIDVFHQAAIDGDRETLQSMMDTAGHFGISALLESRNSAGWTALMWAAWHNKVPAMRALVEASACVNAADRYGQSALSLAAENSNGAQERAVSLLLDSGALQLCGYEGKTPAEWADETGNFKIATLLRKAPTRHARWMAAEQRLALGKLLLSRLGRHTALHTFSNEDLFGEIAQWLPYCTRVNRYAPP
jgi:ankyrin repeat protein